MTNKGKTEIGKVPKNIPGISRKIVLNALEPIDRLSRIINGKMFLPSLQMREYVGPLWAQEIAAAEFMTYLKLLCQLSPHARILDIGCGYGMMGIQCKDYLRAPGSYTGIDVNYRIVKWAIKNIHSEHADFRFKHMDINNGLYNPKGKLDASNLVFPFSDESFDLIILKSIFIHLLPRDVENYVREIFRLLVPNGQCIATVHFLNDFQQELHDKGLSSFNFRYGNDKYRYTVKEKPERRLAYDEQYFTVILNQVGMEKPDVYYGTWSGRDDGLSHQDIIVSRKASRTEKQ